MNRIAILCMCLLVVGVFIAGRLINHSPDSESTGFLSDVLLNTTQSQRYDHASPATVISIPEDHGAHENFRYEWWYFTGNLKTPDSREFGYQLTFFRFAQASQSEIDNAWNNDQIWMAHLAVSDIESQHFYADQDMSRQSIGLAGAEIQPLKVWVHSWTAIENKPFDPHALSLDLTARSDEFAIDLSVRSEAPPILQGEHGYSAKSHSGESASHYYSYPSMDTKGQIQIKGTQYEVAGTTWMDREWSSAILQPHQIGWDWFALSLDDGNKIMAFQIRRQQGNAYRHGVLIDQENNKTPLEVIDMVPVRIWQSPNTEVDYPIGWELKFGSDEGVISVAVDSLMPNQEMDFLFRYYEGAVRVSGKSGNSELSGRGYMELTGYN